MTEYVYKVTWPGGSGKVCSLGRLRAIQLQHGPGTYKVERSEVRWEDATEDQARVAREMRDRAEET